MPAKEPEGLFVRADPLPVLFAMHLRKKGRMGA